MKSIKYIAAMALVLLLVGCLSSSIKTSDPNMPSNAFLDAKGSTVGVVLCHGRGKYPTWSVVDPVPRINSSCLKLLTIYVVLGRALKHYGNDIFHFFYHDFDIQIKLSACS